MNATAESQQLARLEQQIDELLVLTQVLSKENRALRAQQKKLVNRTRKAHRKERIGKKPRGINDHAS